VIGYLRVPVLKKQFGLQRSDSVLLFRSGSLGENALEHENEHGKKQERQQSQRQQENDKKGRQLQNDKHELERQEQATAHGIYLLAVYITQRGFYSFT